MSNLLKPYSASMEDLDTTGCFFECHEMRLVPRKIPKLEMPANSIGWKRFLVATRDCHVYFFIEVTMQEGIVDVKLFVVYAFLLIEALCYQSSFLSFHRAISMIFNSKGEICGMDVLDEGGVDMGVVRVSGVLFGGVDWESVDVLVSGIVGGGD
ncbi:hypothetical protein Tco_1105819 [Tanacetum coccineum]